MVTSPVIIVAGVKYTSLGVYKFVFCVTGASTSLWVTMLITPSVVHIAFVNSTATIGLQIVVMVAATCTINVIAALLASAIVIVAVIVVTAKCIYVKPRVYIT